MEVASSPNNEPPSSRLSMTPSLMPPPPEPSFIAQWSERSLRFFEHVGIMWHMLVGSIRAGFRRPFEGRAIVKQLESLGVASVGIVVVTSLFIGMVMAVQFAFGLQKFGGLEYVGRVIALSFARELAPTLTAVIVGGRIGSGMAAELGSMAVTEQIDAIRALGADPLKKLVWPRLLASWLRFPWCWASQARC
jgi:phospholipid/cholesterol/gamma-HCH transport system permease protein